MSLEDLTPGAGARIATLDLPDVDAAMLRAMGLAEGERVCVLRRAPFGGPLHVRVGEASFALARGLACSVTVVLDGPADGPV